MRVTHQEELGFLSLVAEEFSAYIGCPVFAAKISPKSSAFDRSYRLTIVFDEGQEDSREVDVEFNAKPERIKETLSSGKDSVLMQAFVRRTVRKLLSQINSAENISFR